MNNNDVLKKIRYTFDLNDDKMMSIFASGGQEVTREEISAWLKREDDEDFKGIYDKQLATFLNGFINLKRGKREGEQPKPEKRLNNNMVLRKIKIALNLKTEDIVHLLNLSEIEFSNHEVTAFFRKPDQKQYRLCKDQFLRNFLMGMQIKYRPDSIED